MTACVFAFALGVIATLWLPALPAYQWAAFGLLAMPGLVAGRWPRPVAAFVLGFCYAWCVAGIELSERLPRDLDGEIFRVTGVVDSLPERGGRRARFNLAVESLEQGGNVLAGPDRLRLSWYEDYPELRPGQRWRLSVKLRRPHGYFNPGGFDYERWLFREGIDATGYVTGDRPPERLRDAWLSGGLDRVRGLIAERVAGTADAGRMEAALLRALTVGDRRGLDDDAWRVLNATGTSHLVAISGLHVGLVATFAMLLGSGMARLCPAALRRLPARHWGAVAAMLAAATYAALAGFALPTRRALVMVAAALLGLVGRRVVRPLAVLGLALAGVLILDPLAPLGAGFWLSFAAVGALLAAFTGRIESRSAVADGARAQGIVALALAAPAALFFHRLAWASPVANLVAVPLVGLGAVPLALTGAALAPVPGVPGEWALQGAASVLGLFWRGAEWLAAHPRVLSQVPAPSLPALAAAVAGAAWLLAPRGVPGRWAGLVLLGPLLGSGISGPPPGAFRLSVLDVGQGLAVVVRTRAQVLVYDTGPSFRSGFNTAQAVVGPYLLDSAGGRLDRLVISHGDSDHAGGAEELSKRFRPSVILAGEGGIRGADRCRDGQRWQRGGVIFRVLHPPAGLPELGNDSSCVLLIRGRRRSVLLAGDVSRSVERRLVSVHGEALDADLLVAPHHGSASSSSPAFIEAVAPDWVVFATGYGNRFDLPDTEVVERYRRAGARILDTARAGMVRFAPGVVSPWRVTRWRARAGRYWTDRPEPRHPGP